MGYMLKFRLSTYISSHIHTFGKLQKIRFFDIIFNLLSIIVNSVIPYIITWFIWICTAFNVSMQIMDHSG
ncbi:MAG: hypothetical protein IJ736_11425 [Firmicutes bacterium]|nr:hypothetical protein [Bacillota bacterium]